MNKGMADEQQLQNQEHAKQSRMCKKFMLESLQTGVRASRWEFHIAHAGALAHPPGGNDNLLFSGESRLGDNNDHNRPPAHYARGSVPVTPFLQLDFSLIESLTSWQQNFVLSDPWLPDNPIMYTTPGFYELSGDAREQVLRRNCHFLQGTGMDCRTVEVIFTAIANGINSARQRQKDQCA
jgi:hypothetical protein